MPGLGAPVRGLAVQDIEDEALEFGPDWLLPEVGVQGDREGEANKEAE